MLLCNVFGVLEVVISTDLTVVMNHDDNTTTQMKAELRDKCSGAANQSHLIG